MSLEALVAVDNNATLLASVQHAVRVHVGLEIIRVGEMLVARRAEAALLAFLPVRSNLVEREAFLAQVALFVVVDNLEMRGFWTEMGWKSGKYVVRWHL